jgi:hypothetical protein
MKELENIRKQLVAKWNLFSKLGGEWNDGYFAAIRDALSIVDDEINSLEKKDRKNPVFVEPEKANYYQLNKNNDYWNKR